MIKTVIYRLLFFAALFLCLLLGGCGGKRTSSSAESFSEKVYEPRYAGSFSITGNKEGESVIISNNLPWQGGEESKVRLFVSRDGEEPPADFDGQVLKSVPERVVVLSSSYIAMLDALGLINRVAGVSGKQFITNQFILDNDSLIADVGYDGNFNYEALVSAEPDLVLLYGISGSNTMDSRLQELGIPYMYISEYIEEDPLGKAEWIVPVAEMMGCRERGVEVFDSLAAGYERLKGMTASLTERPRVMLNTPYGDSWFMPSSKSYATRLIADAGGDYLYKKNDSSSSVPIDIEEAYLLTSEADYWLNVSRLRKIDDLKSQLPRFAELPVVERGDVYNTTRLTTPGGGNDYWESGIMHPDVVLADLIRILHPELLPDHEFYYYEKLK